MTCPQEQADLLRALPADTVKSSVPVGQILGTVMMVYFGITTLRVSSLELFCCQ